MRMTRAVWLALPTLKLLCADWNTTSLKWIYCAMGSLTPDFPFNSKDKGFKKTRTGN